MSVQGTSNKNNQDPFLAGGLIGMDRIERMLKATQEMVKRGLSEDMHTAFDISRRIDHAAQSIIKISRTGKKEEIEEAIKKGVKEAYLTLQYIEDKLRNDSSRVWLIAKKCEGAFQDKRCSLPNGATQKPYYVFVQISNEQEALQEIAKESENYKDNFFKLNDAGFI